MSEKMRRPQQTLPEQMKAISDQIQVKIKTDNTERSADVFNEDMDDEKEVDSLTKNETDIRMLHYLEQDASHKVAISNNVSSGMEILKKHDGEHKILVDTGGKEVEIWYDGQVKKFFKRFVGEKHPKSFIPSRFGFFLDSHGFRWKLNNPHYEKKVALDAQENQVTEESSEEEKAVISDDIIIKNADPVFAESMPLAVAATSEVAVDAEISKEKNVEKDPFDLFYERIRTSSTLKEGSRAVSVDSLIASIESARAVKLSLKDLKKAFRGHYGFYRDIEGYILSELETKKDQPNAVDKEAADQNDGLAPEKQNADNVIHEDFLHEIQTHPDLAALSSVEADFAKDPKNADFLHLGLKKSKSEVSSDAVETPPVTEEVVLNERLFGKNISEEEFSLLDAQNENIAKLKETLVSARKDYAQMDHKKTTAWDGVKRFFGKSLSKDEDQDVAIMKMTYQSALMDYKNARLDQVRGQSTSGEEIKAGLVEMLKEIEIEERMSLYAARTEVKAESLGGKMLDGATLSVDWYRNFYKKLSTPEKFLFSGFLFGAGAGLSVGASFGIAGAGAGFWALKAFGGASSGRGLFDMLETYAQGRRTKKGVQEIETLDAETLIRRLETVESDVDERLNELMRGRAWRAAAGVLMAALPLSVSAYNAGAEALQSHGTHPVEAVSGKVKEAGNAAHEKVLGFLDTYAHHGGGVTSDTIHLKGISSLMSSPAEYTPLVVADPISLSVESVTNTAVNPVTAVVEKGGTIIESLRHLKVSGIHPIEAWNEYAALNMDNPFAVSEKFTMPGAEVIVEGGKIADIIDKQGVLLGMIRKFSGDHPSVWREVKDMSLDQIRSKHPDMYQKMMGSIAKYQEYLGDNMPPLSPGQSAKQWVAGLTKAYVAKKGWV